MDKIKFILTGVLGGLGYAFISFFLVTPSLRNNPEGFLFWGIEGFLFAIFFILISALFPKRESLTSNGIKGMMSGILACSFFGVFTYYNAVIRPQKEGALVIRDVKMDVIAGISYYTLGFALLGTCRIDNLHNEK